MRQTEELLMQGGKVFILRCRERHDGQYNWSLLYHTGADLTRSAYPVRDPAEAWREAGDYLDRTFPLEETT